MMLFHFHRDYWLVCEMLQQKLHFFQNVQGLVLSKPRQKSHPIKAAPPGVMGATGAAMPRLLGLSPGHWPFLPIRLQGTGRSTPSQVTRGCASLPHPLNKRPCRSLLCLAESGRSINICWVSLIILMKRDPFVFLGHWICHLLNSLWLPGLTNL